MTARFYSNSASVGTISGSLNNTDTTTTASLSSGAPTSWPSTPCTAAINLTLADEEIVLVTAISGSNVTFTRGYDSSTVRSHTAGATLTHVSAAIDFREANTHIQAITGVHGISGNVVGTTDAQSLSNKTLLQPTIGDYTNADHDHSSAAQGGAVPQASVTGLTAALAAKAVDTGVLHTTGNETAAGNKTFSGTTTLSGTTNAQAVNGTAIAGSASVKSQGNNVIQSVSGAFLMQSGFTHVTTDTNGRAIISLNTNYSNASYLAVVTISTTAGASQYANVVDSLKATNQFVVEVYGWNGSAVVPSTSAGLNVSWIAIGS